MYFVHAYPIEGCLCVCVCVHYEGVGVGVSIIYYRCVWFGVSVNKSVVSARAKILSRVAYAFSQNWRPTRASWAHFGRKAP